MTCKNFVIKLKMYLSKHNIQRQLFFSIPAPLGSISSMEVNVDMLEQMELLDISDQEVLDVFFSASGDEASLTSPLPGTLQSFTPGREYL